MATLTAVLLASLFGSLHCVGMCGALLAFAVGSTEDMSNVSRFVLNVAYNGGRLLTYALLGVISGLLGAALDLGASMVGLHRVAALLAGAMMVAVGLVTMLRYGLGWPTRPASRNSCSQSEQATFLQKLGLRLPQLTVPAKLQRLVVISQRAALGLRPLPRALTVGLLTAFLPCGWLYAFAIVAAGSSSALWGAAIMIAFWAGTLPALASLGVAVQTLTGTLGRRIPLATAAAIMLLGLGTIAQRLAISGESLIPAIRVTDDRDIGQKLEAIQRTPPPCCPNHPDAAESHVSANHL